MARYSPSVQNLITKLGKLPGIGGKSAQRLAFYILSMPSEDVEALTGAINEARRLTKRCGCCQNFTDSDPCPICADPRRDKSMVCVVESPRDITVFERMHEYNGLYHVLHGVYNPVDNMNLKDITLTELFERLTEHPEIKEVIVATNQTAEGNATALYISRLLSPSGIKVTRLASGLPMGSDIEFADDLTLASAFKGRKTVGS
ncbi:MAG: recombination protein RecR [Clostridiales bacterium]|nr:recombination protein RecR [Clostridiales bacterium]